MHATQHTSIESLLRRIYKFSWSLSTSLANWLNKAIIYVNFGEEQLALKLLVTTMNTAMGVFITTFQSMPNTSAVVQVIRTVLKHAGIYTASIDRSNTSKCGEDELRNQLSCGGSCNGRWLEHMQKKG